MPTIYLYSQSTIQDTQSDRSTVPLVDLEVQTSAPMPRTSPDAADTSKTPHITMPHHHLPPFSSLQPLKPSPFKWQDTHTTTSQFTSAPHNDSKLSEKADTMHFSTQTGQFHNPTLPNSSNITPLALEHLYTTNYDLTNSKTAPTADFEPQIIDSDIPTLVLHPLATPDNLPPSFPPISASKHHTSLLATPTIIIHAQMVVINNYPTSTSLSTNKNSSTRNSEDKPEAWASPTTSVTPPWDLSGLHSHHHPFSSLQQCSRWCQSMPVWGLNWNHSLHFKDLSQSQAPGWIPPVHYH